MKAFSQPLQELAAFEELTGFLAKGSGAVAVSGCTDAQKPHLIFGLSRVQEGPRLVVVPDEQRAAALLEDCRLFCPEALLLPTRDLLFYQSDIRGTALSAGRMQVYRALLTQKAPFVITSFEALMDRMLPLEELKKYMLHFAVGETLNTDALRAKLVFMGYTCNYRAAEPGEFSIRGGIVDIFPITEELPFRIELWDDEIDSIRTFHPESQRSVAQVEEMHVFPVNEYELTKKPLTGGILELLLKKGKEEKAKPLIFVDEPARCLERGEALETLFAESMKQRLEKGKIKAEEILLPATSGQVAASIGAAGGVLLSSLDGRTGAFGVKKQLFFNVKSVHSYQGSFALLCKDLAAYKKDGYRTILLCSSKSRAQRMAGDLQQEGLSAFYSDEAERCVQGGEILVRSGGFRKGFSYPDIRFVVLTETDIFGTRAAKKKKKQFEKGEPIAGFAELSPGDFVIHENHGLGIFRGVEAVEINHTLRDYMKIEYRDGSMLYVLATQFDLIQRYRLAEDQTPKLNSLGGGEWKKTKARVKGAVKDIAKEMVALYAARQSKSGYAYSEDTIWQREFEEMFPFEETSDQLKAIAETKADMESTKIMDRLICGDVGFGKTEVAIRAAFKAVQENKQVVYLVPTTILAQQHYTNFCQRLKDFPVQVEMISRFRTQAQQRETLRRLRTGMVDILIGTHRVLSKDVVFKDLGLLIIDEEQRFGVSQKEKIKQLKQTVDVLSLSATPIPRTLHMSLVGMRDMSVLEEPPQDRLPIQTYVMEYDEELVREAMRRELSRGGQVYYVYNRVNNIAEVAGRIARLMPDAVVVYAHGQMSERELEQVMYDFLNGNIDILVSTTIIETGMDIGNVNTIIIHDADNFGLSQLYQLRGRVGRSNRTAYAFLLYRRNKMLKEVAEKRLSAIREFTELGSGIRIAMKDLEIRGAGNVLGAQQHGHMEAVGYELYCKLLKEAIRAEKGEAAEVSFDTVIDLEVDAHLPGTYIENEFEKLDLYKRIAALESKREQEELLDELIDRFGEPPLPVLQLLSISLLREKAKAMEFTEIREKGNEIYFYFYEEAAMDVARLPLFVQQMAPSVLFSADKRRPHFVYKKSARGADSLKIVEQVLRVYGEIVLAE